MIVQGLTYVVVLGTQRDGDIRYVGLTPSRDVEGKTEKKDLCLDSGLDDDTLIAE